MSNESQRSRMINDTDDITEVMWGVYFNMTSRAFYLFIYLFIYLFFLCYGSMNSIEIFEIFWYEKLFHFEEFGVTLLACTGWLLWKTNPLRSVL